MSNGKRTARRLDLISSLIKRFYNEEWKIVIDEGKKNSVNKRT